MKLLYFDCFAGISVRRMLGALLAVGADVSALNAALADIFPDIGARVEAIPAERGGIPALHAVVQAPQEVDLAALLPDVKLPPRVLERFFAVTDCLSAAQTAEGTNPAPLSTRQALTLVCVCLALEQIDAGEILFSPLHEGNSPHPAVSELARTGQIVLHRDDCPHTLITPLGAAIAATLSARFGTMPEMDITSIGYGAGERELDTVPNVVRAVTGEQGTLLFDQMLEEALFSATV